MNLYFDTSALCRYYHSEHGSDRVVELVDAAESHCTASWLTVLETQSAFAQLARMGAIKKSDFYALSARFEADIGRRLWKIVRVYRAHYQTAADLIEKHGQKRRLRSLDALHLGNFLGTALQGEVDHLVTADLILADLAALEGIRVINPLST